MSDGAQTEPEPMLDPVTGAYSHTLLLSRLHDELDRGRRYGGVLSICWLEPDSLEGVVDLYGQTRADQLLRELASRLRQLARGSDLLFRHVDGALVLVAPNTSGAAAQVFSQRLIDSIGEALLGDPPLVLALSCGIASFPQDGQLVEELLEAARQRWREARRAGGGNVVGTSSAVHPMLAESPLLERESAQTILMQFMGDLSVQGRGILRVLGVRRSGRTRMLARACELAQLRGYSVIHVRGSRALQSKAYGALSELPWFRELVSSERRVVLREAARQLLEELPGERLLIAVDNLDELDQPSIRLLTYLFSTLAIPSFGLIYSDNPGGALIPVQSSGVVDEIIKLYPLSAEGLHIWLRQALCAEAPHSFIDWLHQESLGLPGNIQRGLELLAQRGTLRQRGDGAWLVDQGYAGQPLQSLLAASEQPSPARLPVLLNDFIGREREIEQITALLEHSPLVTLLGPGGIGKTSLAIQVAMDLQRSFADGVCFVALASIADPALVASTIAQALGVVERGHIPLSQALAEALRERHMLLVLDNFEQLLESAPLLSELLLEAPRLKLLVTSRAVLHISGEQTYVVPPMSLPDPRALPPTEQLLQYEAIRFFVDRARALKPGFRLTESHAAAIVELCRRLDGLPLAIELAAARVRLLPPRALLSRLNSRLRLLTGGSKDRPERQQTIRAAIEWGYNLLDWGEQALFRRVAVFVNGWTLEAAEQVCAELSAGGAEVTLDVLSGSASLIDKSMIYQREVSGVAGSSEERFLMLETLREYALEQLGASGELEPAQRAHALYYVALAEELERHSSGSLYAQWLDQLEREHGNLRAVLGWALEHDEYELALRLAGSIWKFWHVRGYFREGLRWMETIVQQTGASHSRARARALWGAGWMAFGNNAFEQARAHFAQGAALAGELQDAHASGLLLHGLGVIDRLQGNYERARAAFEQSLPLFEAAGDGEHVAWTYLHLGVVCMEQGDHVAAIPLMEQSLAQFRRQRLPWQVAEVLTNLGSALNQSGEHARAVSRYEEALAISEELGDLGRAAIVRGRLGQIAFKQGDHVQARELYLEHLVSAHKQKNAWALIWTLERLAELAEASQQIPRSVTLWSTAERMRDELGMPLSPEELQHNQRLLSAARALLDPERFEQAWREGRELSQERAIAFALEQ